MQFGTQRLLQLRYVKDKLDKGWWFQTKRMLILSRSKCFAAIIEVKYGCGVTGVAQGAQKGGRSSSLNIQSQERSLGSLIRLRMSLQIAGGWARWPSKALSNPNRFCFYHSIALQSELVTYRLLLQFGRNTNASRRLNSAPGLGQSWFYIEPGGQEAGDQLHGRRFVALGWWQVEWESIVWPVSCVIYSVFETEILEPYVKVQTWRGELQVQLPGAPCLVCQPLQHILDTLQFIRYP